MPPLRTAPTSLLAAGAFLVLAACGEEREAPAERPADGPPAPPGALAPPASPAAAALPAPPAARAGCNVLREIFIGMTSARYALTGSVSTVRDTVASVRDGADRAPEPACIVTLRDTARRAAFDPVDRVARALAARRWSERREWRFADGDAAAFSQAGALCRIAGARNTAPHAEGARGGRLEGICVADRPSPSPP